MKITAPKDANEYLTQTADFVMNAYAGLESGWRYYQKALPGTDVLALGGRLTPAQQEAVDRFLNAAQWRAGQKFSEGMHAGSILQTAYMAIRLYSRSTAVPAHCAAMVPAGHPAAAFCIGAERRGMPSGLIVYAGRSQYSHWDDGEPHAVTAHVFKALRQAFSDGTFADLAPSSGNSAINVYANEILLTVLGWTTYAIYLQEIEAMLA